MNNKVCSMLNIEFPLFAFSHCRDVVAAVSNAGGFGVLGCAGHTAESLDIELRWLDDHINGNPYGVDLLIPTSLDSKESALSAAEVEARIPPEHKAHVESILAQHGIDTKGLWDRDIGDGYGDNLREKGASVILDAAFSHPVKMVVNALGVPPDFMLDRARRAGIVVGALAGATRNTRSSTPRRVSMSLSFRAPKRRRRPDTAAPEVSTMVDRRLIPEVLEALKP